MVADFSLQYHIEVYNMTDYQEHVMYHLDNPREYELLTIVNGFSNISLSGNITHSFNSGGEMFTVHYMSCVGEEAEMGWKNKKDFILFTMLVLPGKNTIQKFHLYEHFFHIDNPAGVNYFYGYKGSSDDEISGRFIENYDGISFQVESLKPYYSYGLIFVPLPADVNYIDNRVHPNTYKTKIASAITILGIGALVGTFFAYRAYQARPKSDEERYLKEVSTDISITSKRGRQYSSSDEDSSPTRKEDTDNNTYQISTVPEVEEGL